MVEVFEGIDFDSDTDGEGEITNDLEDRRIYIDRQLY